MNLRSVVRKIMDAIQGPPHVAGTRSATDRMYDGKINADLSQSAAGPIVTVKDERSQK
jgi:hypothetical protein